ncbi:hypothetical protein O9992_18285 [Vibrio lentus]|nr:hypothetical protein [Vibrio lentus]
MDTFRYCGSPFRSVLMSLNPQKQVCGWQVCQKANAPFLTSCLTFQPLAEIKRRFERNRVAIEPVHWCGRRGQSVWLSIEVQAQDYLSQFAKAHASTNGRF